MAAISTVGRLHRPEDRVWVAIGWISLSLLAVCLIGSNMIQAPTRSA